MWKLLSTKTSISQSGMSVVKIRFAPYGDITSRTPRFPKLTFSLLIFKGLIFVVDSNDRERILEAKEELNKMACQILDVVSINSLEKRNFEILFCSFLQISRFHLNLCCSCQGSSQCNVSRRNHRQTWTQPTSFTKGLIVDSSPNLQWYVQATCATQGEGLYEGLDWLSNELSTRR
jgi:ADP-ribosylation factor protein 4